MLALEVIDDPAAAAAAMDPLRARLLAALAEPASAAAVAGRVGESRQKVNYHLRTLEQHGLVRQVGERRWGGLSERVLAATARSYVVSPSALGVAAADPTLTTERLSARYLVALAARLIREVADLINQSEVQGKRLATLSMDTEVRFGSAAARAAFTRELTAAVTGLVARYHDADAPGGRAFRLVLAAHPRPRALTSSGRHADLDRLEAGA